MDRHHVIDVSDLPEPFVGALEAAIGKYRQSLGKSAPDGRRPIGWAADLPELPEAFFEPLPDAVLDLFDGKPL
jgi:hypothetical protein